MHWKTCIGFVVCVILGICLHHKPLAADTSGQLITFEDIKKIAPSAQDEFVQALVDAKPDLEAAGINTRLRMAHFLAQVMTETGGLGRLDENMNYSEGTLLRVFSRRTVSAEKAREIAGKPKEVANWVYGARLGNRGRDTDDGWNFRGSGFIQLTGRSNFRARGAELGLPLEQDPEIARRAREGLQAAIAYWGARNINAAADDHDRERVRILVNGPKAHGLPQAKEWFNRAWLRVFQAKEAEGFEAGTAIANELASDETGSFDEMLRQSGLLADDFSSTEADAGNRREDALRAFQQELGLPETGLLDEATQDALLDPREWKHLEDESLILSPEDDPEGSVSFNLVASEAAGLEMATLSLQPNSGSGEVSSSVNILPADLASLETARAVYSEYEVAASTTPATRENFKPFSVVGTDDRVAINDTTGFPSRAIVQILFNNQFGAESLCTGTMISEDTVLTAAHCIHSGTIAGASYSNYRVMPGRNKGAAPFGRCGATRTFVLRGWTTAQIPLDARYYDIGAIKLDCDVGQRTGWLGVEALADSGLGVKTTVQGYAADLVPPGRQWVSEDELRVLWELKGFYQNDTYGGTSGAAVTASDRRETIIGVHTNGLHGEAPWSTNNAFTRITPERLAIIQGWISE